MKKPVLLTVDDEPQVRSAVERDLRRRYRESYRVVKASSGAEGLEVVRELKRRGTSVALFLVDQRMPHMSGTEFLREAREFFPDAKKVLLTAYADTEAAIQSINDVGLDHYLMKPWDPPETHLYPVLDDLLEEWAATAHLPYDGIRVAGIRWSSPCHAVKDFLARNRIPYQWLDVERDPEAAKLVASIGDDRVHLPVVFFPDGDYLVQPGPRDLAERIGLQTQAKEPFYDLIIVGAGPAGLGAAVYGASEGLRTAIIEREATGGQAGTSSRIENYLGFPSGVSGWELARRATIQAQRFGAEVLTTQEVTGVRTEDPYRIVTLADGAELSCHALLIATGMTVRRLDAPGVEALTGRGVYYGAAVTEAAHHKGEHVLVVGGANSAGQGAVFLARYAERVTMLVRRGGLEETMSSYLIDQIDATQNIAVRPHSEVVEAKGDGRLEAVLIRDNRTGETEEVEAGAMFVFIGAVPHSDLVAGAVERNDRGFILTGPDLIRGGRRPRGWRLDRDPYLLETSVPGIFAAGDVRHGVVRRVATAVGEGALAVSFIHRYLESV